MRKLCILLGMNLLLAASIAAAQAPDPNVDLMKKLYTKIGLAVGVGSNDPQTGESFLVMANPGILVDPNLDLNTPQRTLHARQVDRSRPQPELDIWHSEHERLGCLSKNLNRSRGCADYSNADPD